MRPDSVSPQLTWYIDGGHTQESIDVAGRWFATRSARSESEGAMRILIFNQQTRDASSLARRLHDTLSKALHDDRPFRYAIFCPNTTYRNAGYKADLVSINTNKDDVNSLRVQQELAKTWDGIDPRCEVAVVGTIEEAVEKARSLPGLQPAEVLATGSLHLVGGLIEVLESEAETTAKL
jgi:folylpolyglutamate synthase